MNPLHVVATDGLRCTQSVLRAIGKVASLRKDAMYELVQNIGWVIVLFIALQAVNGINSQPPRHRSKALLLKVMRERRS